MAVGEGYIDRFRTKYLSSGLNVDLGSKT